MVILCMDCDTQFKLLMKLIALEKDFAEEGYLPEAYQLRVLVESFNDKYLVVLPQE